MASHRELPCAAFASRLCKRHANDVDDAIDQHGRPRGGLPRQLRGVSPAALASRAASQPPSRVGNAPIAPPAARAMENAQGPAWPA
ncbi:hypothetical protein M3I54_29055 [Paraburkholderia sp. CNPSo 3274]|uniref:hypothetical protein n=1 Tax=Paraburkholderia sp. CNPSo 3274 TaxID=2940932 RepID=UPI0020B8EEAE|nr:hypothetical protein [Paraburkholderia sp. CNPSo 3274]MCP3710977.1 hypothetical protein [Paraburkholderia sp. CNPSo 3274]